MTARILRSRGREQPWDDGDGDGGDGGSAGDGGGLGGIRGGVAGGTEDGFIPRNSLMAWTSCFVASDTWRVA